MPPHEAERYLSGVLLDNQLLSFDGKARLLVGMQEECFSGYVSWLT